MDQVATSDTKNKEMMLEERTTTENMVTGMAEMAKMKETETQNCTTSNRTGTTRGGKSQHDEETR